MAKVPIDDPRHWRERAEEARAVAGVMTDEKTKKMMLRIADDYETMAKHAERRLLAGGKIRTEALPGKAEFESGLDICRSSRNALFVIRNGLSIPS